MKRVAMGRAPTWNEADLLATVMQLFREHGYADTSVRDLERATGVRAGSLYHAFGSKDGLFSAAVAAYNERVVRHRVATHLDAAPHPLEGLRTLFTSTFDDCDPENQDNPGCLLTNSALEAPMLPPSARAPIADGFGLLRDGLERVVRRAVAGQELSADADPGALASQLLTLYQGVLVLVRFGTPAAALHAVVDQALPALLAGSPSTPFAPSTLPSPPTPSTLPAPPSKGSHQS
jgi:TetR/AcrR family transcriptional repressor of nem operon